MLFIDTLYCVRDLNAVLAATRRLLKPGGRVAAFYSALRSPGSMTAIEALRARFEAEGNSALRASRLHETRVLPDAHRDGRIRRYLYIATVPE